VSSSFPRDLTDTLDWARAAGVLDPRTTEYVSLYETDRAEILVSASRRDALREILAAGSSKPVAALVVPEGRRPDRDAAPFREVVLRDRSGLLFGKLLRDGRLLLVETENAESPGRIWARVKILIPALSRDTSAQAGTPGE
jgi:hypothetical protein